MSYDLSKRSLIDATENDEQRDRLGNPPELVWIGDPSQACDGVCDAPNRGVLCPAARQRDRDVAHSNTTRVGEAASLGHRPRREDRPGEILSRGRTTPSAGRPERPRL